MGDTSAIIFQNENCPAIIFGSGHQGLLGHWGRRQFWATILIIDWVATAVLSGPRLGSEALVRCSLLDEQLVPPHPVRKLPCLASQGKYQPQQVIFKMNIEAAVSTKRLHRQMAQGSK